MQIEINPPEVLKELEYSVKIHRESGAPNRFKDAPSLVAYILSAVGAGSY